jgi:hypothetical protein
LGTKIFADLPVPFFTDFPAHDAQLEYRKNAWGSSFLLFSQTMAQKKNNLYQIRLF